HVLKSWNTPAWAALFGVSLFGLIQVMLRPHATEEGPSHTPLVTTIVLFVLFAAASVAFRWYFVRKQLLRSGEENTSWRDIAGRLAGEMATGPAKLAATTDGVT